MAITRYNPKKPVEIKPGQFVCFAPIITAYVSSRPHKVIKVSGSRVFFRDIHDEYDDSYKSLTNVLFVCDTKEEGLMLSDLNDVRFNELRIVEKEFARKWIEIVDAVIAGTQERS